MRGQTGHKTQGSIIFSYIGYSLNEHCIYSTNIHPQQSDIRIKPHNPLLSSQVRIA